MVMVCWTPLPSTHWEMTDGFLYRSSRRGSGEAFSPPNTSSLSGGVFPCTGSGTSLAMRSPSAKGSPMTRTTSRITERALSEPKVMICPTLSRPYFSRT